MPQIADLKAKISVDGADKAKSDLKSVGESASKTKGDLGGLGGGIGGLKDAFVGGLGAIAGALTGLGVVNVVGDAFGFLKDQMLDVLEQASSQQQVMAQTSAVIKSTGGAAGVTAGQVGDLADSYARLTGVSDDQIQSAENILLTFTDIKSNIFPQVTKTVLDMAQAFHQDLQTSAIEVGKALQDPVAGATALRRVGVQLSDSQMELIKHFVATGDKAKAQAIIMKELTRETGGSAEAAGKTLPGMLARLNVSFDQMKEKIGLAVLPILQSLLTTYLMPLADWLGKVLPVAAQKFTDFLNNQVVPAINAWMQSPIVQTIESWATSINQSLMPALGDKGVTGGANKASGALGDKGLTHAAGKAKGALKDLATQAGTTGGDIDSAKGLTGHVNAGIKSITGLAIAIDGPENGKTPSLTPAMTRYQQKLKDLDGTQAAANKSSQNSIPVLSGLGDMFGGLGDKIGQAKDQLGQFASDVGARLDAAEKGGAQKLQQLGKDFSDFGPSVHKIWDGFWGSLTFPVRIAFDQLHALVVVSMDVLAGNLTDAEQDAAKWRDRVLGDVNGFFVSMSDMITGAGEFLLTLLTWPFKQMWANTVQSLDFFQRNFGHYLDGITRQVEDWGNHLRSIINGIVPSWLPGFKIPGFASGTNDAPGGLMMVGEHGPELVYLPQHSVVKTATETRTIISGASAGGGSSALAGSGGATYHITVNGADANSQMQLVRKLARHIDWKAGLHG